MDEAVNQPLGEKIEEWLAKIRHLLPIESTLVVTVHRVSKQFFQVAFRANALGETFISKVKARGLEEGVERAGQQLFDRLEESHPAAKQKWTDRVRGIFDHQPKAG